MACSACQRRQIPCDAVRPRCGACKISHVRCNWESEQANIAFRDETQAVVANYSRRKRRKISTTFSDEKQCKSDKQNPTPSHESDNTSMNQDLGLIEQPWPAFNLDTPVIPELEPFDDIYQGFMFCNDDDKLIFQGSGENFESPLYAHDLTETQVGRSSASQNLLSPVAASTAPSHCVAAETPHSDSISEHVLAQHYARTLTARYSSRHPGWNFYMHFYNRFATGHQEVRSAIYAWTSAHLFFSKSLSSLENALAHYEESFARLSQILNQEMNNAADSWAEDSLNNSIQELSNDVYESVIVALYFLASFDLFTDRPKGLRKILLLVSTILKSTPKDPGRSGTSQRVLTWFSFLDARASAFGFGDCAIIQQVGGEAGLVQSMYVSRDFLKKEYSVLNPMEEFEKDGLHASLLEGILRLVAIFGMISRFYNDFDENVVQDIRNSLDDQARALNIMNEADDSEKKRLSTFYIFTAFYHAVEIYFSRAFFPGTAMYTANDHATNIILTTEKLYRIFGLDQSEPPRTKTWPIPLVLAAIEIRDPVYRSWAVSKMKHYDKAGSHYKKSLQLVERVIKLESEKCGRVHIGAVITTIDGGGYII